MTTRALLVMLAMTTLLAGCTDGCEPTNTLVPVARVTFDIEWNEPEARAGMIAAGFDPGRLPMGEEGYVYASNDAIALLSRATSTGSDLSVSYPAQGERGLSDEELADAQARGERDLEPALLSLLAQFEDGSTWTRAGPHMWDHAVSKDAC